MGSRHGSDHSQEIHSYLSACDLTPMAGGGGPVARGSSKAAPPRGPMEYGRGRFWHAHAATKAAWTCQNSPPADLVLPSLRVGSLTSPASASPGVKSQAEALRMKKEDSHAG